MLESDFLKKFTPVLLDDPGLAESGRAGPSKPANARLLGSPKSPATNDTEPAARPPSVFGVRIAQMRPMATAQATRATAKTAMRRVRPTPRPDRAARRFPSSPWRSGTSASYDRGHSRQQDPQVEHQTAAVDVAEIEPEPLIEVGFVATTHLP